MIARWASVSFGVLAAALGAGGCGEGSAGSSGGGATTGTQDGATTTSAGAGGSSTGAGGATSAARVLGVTVDSLDDVPATLDALSSLPVRPTARIVFDELVPASDYVADVGQLHAGTDVMGELLDSFYVADYSTDAYLARADEYLDALGDTVDVWEVGNEVNGEWLCNAAADSCSPAETAEVVAKIHGAFERAQARGKRTALTLYENQDCWSSPDNEMLAWASANVPEDMRSGLDWVLVSYYEDDCNGLVPDWQPIFDELGVMFPKAKLGIGECGTLDPSKKAEFVQRYYGLAVEHPRFMGGYFWWYFQEDMVPKSQPLFAVLATATAGYGAP